MIGTIPIIVFFILINLNGNKMRAKIRYKHAEFNTNTNIKVQTGDCLLLSIKVFELFSVTIGN